MNPLATVGSKRDQLMFLRDIVANDPAMKEKFARAMKYYHEGIKTLYDIMK